MIKNMKYRDIKKQAGGTLLGLILGLIIRFGYCGRRGADDFQNTAAVHQ